MFKFSIDSSTFNGLIKRLLLLAGSDSDSIVSFLLEKGELSIYYHSKLEKGGNNSLYYEKLKTNNSENESGISSIYISQLFSVKIPEKASEDRFPRCEEVCFEFAESILKIKFDILWSKTSKPNTTTLNFPLLEKNIDLETYSSILNICKDRGVFLDSSDLIEGISMCNFVKSDVTSKDSNGVFLKQEESNLFIVSTDSTIAVKWVLPILKKDNKEDFNLVISPTALNALKGFLVESSEVILTKYKQGLLVETENKKMLLPILGMEYLIEDPKSFFYIESRDFVASVDLKPLQHVLNTISSNNKDLYKRTELSFTKAGLNISTNINKTKDLPSKVSRIMQLSVNSDYILVATSRLSSLGYSCNLFYNEESSRITMCTSDEKLLFLIQGLSI